MRKNIYYSVLLYILLLSQRVVVKYIDHSIFLLQNDNHASELNLLPGLVFLEVTAFYGVYLNLIVYLQDVLHGDSASNAAAVSLWAGASYLMPVLGAAIADSYWGKYKTVLVGLSISLAVKFSVQLGNLAFHSRQPELAVASLL